MSEEKKTDNYTEGQRLAINTRDKTLLISAAAGSGKTFTLIERIVKSVFYAETPLNIEDMLIVTFTRAAAEELRGRLKRKFAEVIDSLPKSERNERQLVMLGCAKICTIDSFCSDFLRSNCEKFDLTPGFRVPDEAEISVLAENLLGGMFSEIYEGNMPDVASPEELFELCDCLTDTGRQNDLEAIIFKIYDDTQSSEEGVSSLDRPVAEYNPENFTTVEKTFFGSYCIERVKEIVSHYTPIYNSVAEEIALRNNPKLDALAAQTEECLTLLRSLDRESEYVKIRELILGADFSGKAVSVRDKTLPPTTKLRNSLKADIENLKENFFIYTEQDWLRAYEGLYRVLGVLLKIVKKYDAVFRAEKRRRGICEYSDIERYTYEALWQDGELTDTALSERAKYSAVYIDEYQDVNNLQNKIFEAIASDTNRFMVGDIKQSIYRFRSANPDIFAGMKKEFPPIENAENSTRASIFMSENFRCDKGIVDFVNIIFNKLFGILKDSVGYTEKDALIFAKKPKEGSPEPEYREPEICLIDSSGLKADYAKCEVELDDRLLTPRLVAQKIRELKATAKNNEGEELKYGDFAILMRSAKGRSLEYKKALEDLGIPCELSEMSAFFDGPEIRLALCLLNTVDNPYKDIYLSGLMLSPLYSFTPDELVTIRQSEGEKLYTSLMNYTEEHPEFTKGRAFIDALEKYRMLAEGTPTDRLILRLYHETGLLALGARLGQRQKLIQLYEFARSYESSSFHGLYSFIHYVNNIIGRKHSLDKRESHPSENAVNIMTAHASKGLEFAVVFLVDSDRPFGGDKGSPPRFEYAEGFGFGMMLRTPSGLSPVDNPTRAIIRDYRRRRDLEEEVRVLYVALTRARERLYVVSTAGKKMDSLQDDVNFLREYMSLHTVYSARSMLPLMLATHDFKYTEPCDFVTELPPLLKSPSDLQKVDTPTGHLPKSGSPEGNSEKEEFDLCGAKTDWNAREFSSSAEPHTESGTASIVGQGEFRENNPRENKPTVDSDVLLARFNFEYPDKAMTVLPEKLSVSVLYPEVLDCTEAEVAETDELLRDRATLKLSSLGVLPKFISEDGKPTAAERGTATHLFMQFADFDNLLKKGAKDELDRLIKEKFISEKDGKIIRLSEMNVFAKSELIRDMASAKKVWRELRFNVKLPAELFTADEEMKAELSGKGLLVQGVIDCLIEDKDGRLRLIDYKTDRFSKEEKENLALAEEKLRQAHERQLYYYALATEQMFGRLPDTCEVYATALGSCFKMRKKLD